MRQFKLPARLISRLPKLRFRGAKWKKSKLRSIASSFAIFVLVGISIFLIFNRFFKSAYADWWANGGSYAKRKQLTVTNSSASNLSANTTVAVSIDTKTLYDLGMLQSDCDDLRVLYQPSTTSFTELTRHIVYPSGTTCATSTATKVYFNLQVALNSAASTTDYYMYYANPDATTPTSTDNAFDVGAADATLVCPFNGTTTCAAGETPSTATGAIRYSGTKSALNFDGINDYATLTSPTGLNFTDTSTFTAEAWFKLNKLGTEAHILTQGYSAQNQFTIFLIGNNGSNKAAVWLSKALVGTDQYTSTTTLTANQWYHLAFVYSNGVGTLYLNGISETSASKSTANGTTANSSNWDVGRRTDTSNSYFGGIIDEIRVSDTARYSSNFTTSTSPFVRDSNTKLLMHFDENGNDPRNTGKAIDDSGNANHGTITGAKYVGGLVGVDASTSDTGYLNSQSYAGHEGVFIEEGTTNKITNPSFENASAYDTGWTAAGANLTATANTTAPFYKFGSKSEKLIASASAISGTSNMRTISINAASTATHTLSAYVYDGTSGNIGGTVSSSIAKLVFNGTAQTTTYTDMGGGWWRLTYSAAGINGAAEYGVEIQPSKTVYVDGVQLEEIPFVTTYADGSLGNSYSWNGTTNNSTSTRVAASLIYAQSGNYTSATGSISIWINWNKIPNTGFPATALVQLGSYPNILWLGSYGNGTGNDLYVSTGCDNNNGITVTANSWNHIVVTWNNGDYVVYTNGQNRINFNCNGKNPTGNITFGGNVSGWTRTASDLVSDLRIYGTPISSTQVTDLYQTGLVSHSEPSAAVDRFSSQKGQNPVATYHLDEGVGTTAHDSSTYKNTGTISGATWIAEGQCVSGKCLQFDGTNDTVTVASSNSLGTINSVGFWIKPISTTFSALDLDGGTHYISASSGTLSATGFTSPTIYVNGVATTTIAANTWSYVEVTTATSFSASALTLGKVSSTYFNGFIDELTLYPYARSAAQVKVDYDLGSSALVANQQRGLSNGLVGYWKMDDNVSGNNQSLTDSSGNSRTATTSYGANSTGMDCTVAGKFGSGCQLDGVDDKASVTYSSTYDNATNSFSVFAWVYSTSIVSKDVVSNRTADSAAFKGFSLYTVNGSPTYYVDGRIADGSSAPVAAVTGYTTNQWNLIGMVVDRTNNKMIAYLNGTGGQPVSISGVGSIDSTNPTTIGTGAKGYFPGNVDGVRIYNRALSPSEVSQLYNYAPGPVARWKFDEKSGQTAFDTSGNSNNGTLGASTAVASDDPTWTDGKYGGALNFDGSNDQVRVADASNLLGAGSGNHTLTTWIKTSTAANAQLYHAVSGSSQEYIWVLSNGKVRYNVKDDSANEIAGGSFDSTTAVNDGKWHHISTIWDTVGNTAYIYIDGKQDASTTSGTSSVGNITTSGTKYIGSTSSGASFYPGIVDDFRVYNYARTQKQVVEDMMAGHPLVTAGSGGAQSAGPGTRPSAPLAYYKFDEGADNTCKGGTNDVCNSGSGGSTLDGAESGMAVPATATSGWTSSGKFGKAMVFDGGNDYITMGDQNALDFTDSFSISAWLQTSQSLSAGNYAAIAGKGFLANGNGYGLFLSGDDSSRINFQARTQPSVVSISGGTINDNTWHHVVGIRDHGSNTSKIYVDGVLKSTDSSTTLTSYSGSEHFALGQRSTDGDNWAWPFSGSIDEVKIYNYALTADEVKADYNRGSALVEGALGNNSTYQKQAANQLYCVPGDTASCAAPIAEWKFDEKTGQTAYDTSGNSNNGTLGATTGVSTDDPTWIGGKIGGALSFDGGDYVTGTLTNPPSNNFTVEAWVYPKSTGIAVVIGNGGLGYDFEVGGGTPTWQIRRGGINWYDSGIRAVLNEWTHVALTRESSNWYMYINGVKTSSLGSGDPNPPASSFKMGYTGYSPDFTGYIDQVTIFNYVRTPAQIAWDYNQGGPVGWWKMDECTGSTIHDSSDYGRASGSPATGTWSGTGAGITSVGDCSTASTDWYLGKSGKFNASLSFDGVDDYVNVTSTNLTGTSVTEETISLWVKPSSSFAPTPTQGILEDGNALKDGTPQRLIQANGSGLIRAMPCDIGWTGYTTSALSIGNWMHIVWTRSGTTNKIFINGRQEVSSSITATCAMGPNLHIGVGYNQYFDGQIDDVRVFNYALTPTQIKNLYNNSASVRYGPSTGSPN